MKSAIREYGLIVAVIAAAMVGYLFYNYNREAVIDYALDNIGERLVALVGDPSSQETLRDKFAALKSRILDEEVEPAAVEQMAANVLNLSASGEPITMDEAEMLLSEVTEPEVQVRGETGSSIEAGTGGVSAAAKPRKKVKIELEKLGGQLASAIEAQEDLRLMAAKAGPNEPLPPFVVVTTDQGLRFQIDSMMVEVFSKGDVPPSIRQLQLQNHIVWKKHLADQRKHNYAEAQKELEHVKEQLEMAKEIQSMAISQEGEDVQVSVTLAPEIIEKVKVLKELQSKGVWIPAVPDSIQKMVVSRIVVKAPAPPEKETG